LRQEIARALGRSRSREVLLPLLSALAEDSDNDVCAACAAALEAQLGRLGGYPADLVRPRYALLKEAGSRIERYGKRNYPRLAAWLEERLNTDVDLEGLKSFGTVLTLEAATGQLARAYEVDDSIETVSRWLL